MLVEITEDQYNDFHSLNTGRVKDIPVNYQGRHTLPVSNIKSGDTIYVFPNSKIKKLPLRKWMKAIGAKPVFKAEEANVVIVPAKFTGNDYELPMRLNKGYTIPPGKYYYKSSTSGSCFRNIQNVNGEYYSLSDAVALAYVTEFDNGYRSEYVYANGKHYKQVIDILNSKYPASYNLLLSHGLTKAEFDSLINLDNTIVNDMDLQQVLYDWEIENKVRENNDDYNWQGIEDLLLSGDKDSGMIALKIIEKIEIEPIIDRLGIIYLSYKLDPELRKFMYKNIFFRNPEFRSRLPKFVMNRTGYHLGTDVGEYIRKTNLSGTPCDVKYFNKVGWNVIFDGNNKCHIYETNSNYQISY